METETILILLFDDPIIEITLTTIAAYGSFLTAEHFHFTNPEVLASLRREYEQKVERDSAALDELHLERQQLHAEEVQWARRHLLLEQKGAVIDAFHHGSSVRPSRRNCSRTSTRSCCVSNPQKPMGPLSKSRPQTAPMGITRWNSWE